MTGVTDNLVQWLRDQLDEDERIARAAAGVYESGGRWWEDGRFGSDGAVASERGDVVVYRTGVGRQHAAHIALHDPARVLREIDAKRRLLADVLAEPHFRNEEDNWYSCAALVDKNGDPICLHDTRAPGPCDCGRDERVLRQLRLLALPYADRPGYGEKWKP